MRLNTKVKYGLRAMVEIAMNPDGVLQKEISIRQSISGKYLDQIIAGLKVAGLISRGADRKSGYRLLRKKEDISVYDIYKAFEFEMNLGKCELNGEECPFKPDCQSKNYWCDLNAAIRNHMKNKSLAEIIDDLNTIKSDKTIL